MYTYDCTAQLPITMITTGKSLYSNVVKPIHFTKGEVIDKTWYDETPTIYGEFCLYFDTSTWDVSKDGFIYTDETFLKNLHAVFSTLGITDDFYYSEYGMQEANYISFDADEKFLKSFKQYAERVSSNGST